ncbi:hypothetical protein B0H14DRAFT_3744781 [Mycena olivaceomarginata]|nr:hypothetical protein B0H14DRAFT_3744781 [Mycena olivaceomarginata]
MGVDMEAAQVQGASDSFLSTNEPEYSGITTNDPDEFALYFVRACISHAKRGVTSLKSYVTPDVLKRLMDFPYMKTEEDLAHFTSWIDWWTHELQYPWILPSLSKSRSRIDPADWDITDASTNLNEGQHHWTNQQTGVKLTILEAIETALKVDFKTAREVKDSLETGILDNNSNNMLHRMGRNVQRKSNSVAIHRTTTQKTAEADELQARVDAAKAAKKVTDQAVKDAQTALSAAKGTSTGRKSGKGKMTAAGDIPLFQASSSGRVLSPRRTSQKELVPVTAIIPPLPFIDPLPVVYASATPSYPDTCLDFALPFDFGDDLAWLDNLGFISETSQPLDASSNNVPLANTVLNNNPGGTEFQYDGTGELDWLFANVIQGGGHFVASSSQLDWNANGPRLA